MVKETKDDNGIIKCLETIINGTQLTLCNIYAPNNGDPYFIHEVNSIIGNAQGQVILAGDFNQVLDSVLDKSKLLGTQASTPKDRAAIHSLMEDNGLIDVWRLVNPRGREYSFYSHCHKSYSQIDIILISQNLINDVIDSNINAMLLSVHAPVDLCINIQSDRSRRGRWRMNTSLLHDEVFNNELATALSSFFEINMGSTDKVAMVWEASKAYVRGKIIARSSEKKRENMNAIKKLEAELSEMERGLARQYSDSLFNNICKCKFNLHEIFNKKAEYACLH